MEIVKWFFFFVYRPQKNIKKIKYCFGNIQVRFKRYTCYSGIKPNKYSKRRTSGFARRNVCGIPFSNSVNGPGREKKKKKSSSQWCAVLVFRGGFYSGLQSKAAVNRFRIVFEPPGGCKCTREIRTPRITTCRYFRPFRFKRSRYIIFTRAVDANDRPN